MTELTKKAVEMLLNGATLLREPCPYCTGVRVMRDGQALCVSCGSQPEKREIPVQDTQIGVMLEKKMEVLTKELEQEKDHEKQQIILKTINSLLETIGKAKEM